MKVVVVAYGPVGPSRSGVQIDGQYLEHYDPDAYDGRGDVLFTHDPSKARVFSDIAEALTFTRQVPKSRPVRADGQPNRPLTAFHLEYRALGGSDD